MAGIAKVPIAREGLTNLTPGLLPNDTLLEYDYSSEE